jgi:hypothetical protein
MMNTLLIKTYAWFAKNRLQLTGRGELDSFRPFPSALCVFLNSFFPTLSSAIRLRVW